MVYNWGMGNKRKNEGKKKKSLKEDTKTRIIFDLENELGREGEDDGYPDDRGVFMGKEDVQLIYNALKEYKPMPEEEVVRSTWLEMFEEMLVVDYAEPYPDAN
jgi:hypothetical protein